MSVAGTMKRRMRLLMRVAPVAIATSLVSACAPTAYPTVGSYYPVYPGRSPIVPYPSSSFVPQRMPDPSSLQPPTATREPAPANPPGNDTPPAPIPAPRPTPTPGPVGTGDPTPDPVATIDSRPPGSRCGWAELCNLWE
jgi:hypothetical protein